MLLYLYTQQFIQFNVNYVGDYCQGWGLNQHHLTVPSSSPTAKAINYTLKRWPALSRYLDDGNLPICNNWVEVRHEVA